MKSLALLCLTLCISTVVCEVCVTSSALASSTEYPLGGAKVIRYNGVKPHPQVKFLAAPPGTAAYVKIFGSGVASTVFPLVDARVLRFDGVKPRVKFVAAPPGTASYIKLVGSNVAINAAIKSSGIGATVKVLVEEQCDTTGSLPSLSPSQLLLPPPSSAPLLSPPSSLPPPSPPPPPRSSLPSPTPPTPLSDRRPVNPSVVDESSTSSRFNIDTAVVGVITFLSIVGILL